MSKQLTTRLASIALAIMMPIAGTSVAQAQPSGTVQMSAGDTSELKPGETVNIANGDAPLVVDTYGAEQDAPNCIKWRTSKGFTQVTNDCQTDLAVKVYYQNNGQSGCETVEKGTQHNIGFVGWWPMRSKVERVVIC